VAGDSGLPNFIVQEFPLRSRLRVLRLLQRRGLDPHIFAPRAIADSQNHNGDNALREVLLKADVFVGCEKQVKSGFLRRFQQFTIGQSIPTKVLCLPNRVAL